MEDLEIAMLLSLYQRFLKDCLPSVSLQKKDNNIEMQTSGKVKKRHTSKDTWSHRAK